MRNYQKIYLITILLCILGTIMICSASSIWADYKLQNEYFYLIRQTCFLIVGLTIMIVIANLDINLFIEHTNKLLIFGLILLLLVLIPGIGIVRGGARSWIGVGQFSIQPSEFIKLSMILYTAFYLSKTTHEGLKRYMNPTVFLIISFGLIMLQPDLGTGMVLLLSICLIYFIDGLSKKYILYGGVVGLLGLIGLILSAPYRLLRITSFLNPWKDPLGSGFQSIQSLYALSPGSLFGLGLGNSRQKYYYLPEPQTDFIFAILTEELGFIGVLFIFLLYFFLFYYGIVTSVKTSNLYFKYSCLGIVSLIFIQFLINVSVVIGLIPVTGITLPFFSYGGSSLVILLASIGILINISKEVDKNENSI